MCSRLLKKVTVNYDLCCVVVGLDLVGPFYLSARCSLRNSSQKHPSFCQSYSITVTIVKSNIYSFIHFRTLGANL